MSRWRLVAALTAALGIVALVVVGSGRFALPEVRTAQRLMPPAEIPAASNPCRSFWRAPTIVRKPRPRLRQCDGGDFQASAG
jgi:hypothetical protein